MSGHTPLSQITAVVCTRNRGGSVRATVQSVLANCHEAFELIVVDQSTDDRTERSLAPYGADPRLRYVRSAAVGLSRARNLGLALAATDVVAFTDDDCTVPTDWLSKIEVAFARHPRVGVVFSNVDPVPHDSRMGFIPAYRKVGGPEMYTSLRHRGTAARGIGAGMAVRRSALRDIGEFDEMLGVGSTFTAGEDWDVALRALIRGWYVYETGEELAVLHDGFRNNAESRELGRRDWTGIGATFIKPLRAGRWELLPILARDVTFLALLPPLRHLLHGRRPDGARRILFFLRGARHAWKTPVDRRTLRFTEPAEAARSHADP